MPINLLKDKTPIKIKRERLSDRLEMHRSEKEAIKAQQKKVAPPPEPPKVTKVTIISQLLPSVDLLNAFKKYLLKRRLTFTVIFVIILVLIGSGVFAYINYLANKPPVVAVIVNQPPPPPPPPPQPTIVCGNGKLEKGEQCDDGNKLNGDGCSVLCQTEVVIPPVPAAVCGNGKLEKGESCDDGNTISGDGCTFSCQIEVLPPPLPVILPDTELAPLRGSLVKFNQDATIYLVELNGELRKVDSASAYFLNGQKLNNLNPQLIYTLSDNYRNVRQGKPVFGKVDWDPRVLTAAELQPFLQ